MARKKSKEQIHKNMSRVRNSDTALEKLLCEELVRQGPVSYTHLFSKSRLIGGQPHFKKQDNFSGDVDFFTFA